MAQTEHVRSSEKEADYRVLEEMKLKVMTGSEWSRLDKPCRKCGGRMSYIEVSFRSLDEAEKHVAQCEACMHQQHIG